MKLQRIGLTALFAIVVMLTVSYRQFIRNSQGQTSRGGASAQTLAERKAEADRLFQQSDRQFQNKQYEAALQSTQQALAIYREIKDRLIGELETITQQDQSLAQSQNNPRKAEADRLSEQGLQQFQTSQFQAAIQSWQQAVVVYREIHDRQREGANLGDIGTAYQNLGDYGKAINYYQQSLVLAREIQDRQTEGNALRNLGNTYYCLGDYGKAIDYHQQSLAIDREIKDRRGEGSSLGNLGIVYLDLGDYYKAIEYNQRHLAITQEIGDRQGKGNALANLGLAYYSLGNYRQALEYYQQSLAILREMGNRQGQGAVLEHLGIAYRHLGDYAEAIDYFQQALAIAREIQNRRGEGQALGNLGNAYALLGDYIKASNYYKQDLALARQIGNRQGEGAALNNLGTALYKQGNLAVAEKILYEGLEVWESLREKLGSDNASKVLIFEQQAGTYRTLQKVLIAQNKTDTALEISERGRARAFVELLARRLNPTATLPATVLKPTISQLKQIASIQKSTLVQYSIIGDDFKIQGKQQAKESELYIWVIKPTGEVTFRKADLKPLWQQQNTSLSDLVTSTRQSIGVRGRATIEIVSAPGTDEKQRLQKLHDLLIKPIADLLPTDPNSHVIFIPQRELFLVPFVALQDEAGKYLIEKHTILTAPSIQSLEFTRATREKQKGKIASQMLIVGNPTMPSLALKIGEPPQPLSSLKGAEQEAIEIGQLFKTQPLLGSTATETAIKSKISNADIIHLATHGLFYYGQFRQGLPGAVALAPDGKEDGFLTSDEILDLKLNASLVVLSACDTGRGQLSSDGVIGLSRAFISAGTPSIIVSLWAVPDGSTADLMTEFYRQVEKNPNKAQALRQAMLIKMKERPHPRDWAAFTLIGEAQ